MGKMIKTAPGFQYSVNIGYDLSNDDKLRNFIPTRSSIELLRDILRSTAQNSTERARVLIGAYGKGKSHIVLTILSMLMQRPKELFVNLLPKIEKDQELKHLVDNFYCTKSNRILPVVINGTSTSLPQSFLLALQRTLNENGLDVMPETNFKAATNTIAKWKKDYPLVFRDFCKLISLPIDLFVAELEKYNISVYEEFEHIFPSLTAGSVFNPFVGFDVAELYESVVKSLKPFGYSGIFVVYDEFSKFLETNITTASVSDTKMLQDFAEKCNRSGENELHLLLISHKEISNYIDKLPKQKVDGWRGVSERFLHIHLNNNFSQTYEIISTVILKDTEEWDKFQKKHKSRFDQLLSRYSNHPVFSDAPEEVNTVVFGCYPLHPISTMILPRLSERIAQNERTLFTFLSADGASTLSSALNKKRDSSFNLITPDLIFDYFDPVFQKEPLSSELHSNYVLTKKILNQIGDNEMQCKIVKTISLIYALGHFDKLKPIKEELIGIYVSESTADEIDAAIEHLIRDEYVIYLKKSNNFLKLKQTSGVDIEQRVSDMISKMGPSFSLKATLKNYNIDNYLYPSRYNDKKEMVRYFEYEFIEESELEEPIDWGKKSESSQADGIVYAIVPEQLGSIAEIHEKILKSSRGCERNVFIVPKQTSDIRKTLMELNAICLLKEESKDDEVLFEELEVIYEDLREVVGDFIRTYTHPEDYKASFIYDGKVKKILRKATLTGLASDICDRVFPDTPVINNEAINRNEISSMAMNSRMKILAGLLRNELEPNLGLTGSGQEVSIMRSTLIMKRILVDDNGNVRIDLKPDGDDRCMNDVLDCIVGFVTEAKAKGSALFSEVYDRLTSPKHHIGLRKGLIPIYLSTVFHEYKDGIIIYSGQNQLPLIPDTLQLINANPGRYELKYLDWSQEKRDYVNMLESIFKKNVIDSEKRLSAYDFVVSAMRRWYLSLPRYSKETKNIDSKHSKMLRLLKQNLSGNELLFEKLPAIYGFKSACEALAKEIAKGKKLYDQAVLVLMKKLELGISEEFDKARDVSKRVSLASILKDWCDSLDQGVFEQLFENGTDRCLKIFKNATEDSEDLIAKMAKVSTGLRLEDWDDDTIKVFFSQIALYRQTAEDFYVKQEQADYATCEYELRFKTGSKSEVKRFDRVVPSNRAKLFYNSIMAEIESMGSSISEQEKRQVLMDILQKMC